MPHSIELIANTRKKTKETIRVQDLLPEDLREKSATLIQLLRDYYTHINESGQASYEINSINASRDIDTADAVFLDKIQKEIAAAIPKNIVADRVTLYKNLIRYYSVRGSQDSIELFFKVLFNDNVEVYYPREDMLIASNGVWNAGAVRPVYTKSPDVIISGNGTGATAHAIVSDGAVQSIEIVDGGTGYTTAPLTISGDGTGASASAVISNGEILKIFPGYYTTGGIVYTRGSGYTAGAVQVVISGGTGFAGTPAEAEAYVNEAGEIDRIEITNPGSGYTSGSVTATILGGSGFGGTPADLTVEVNSIGVITSVNIIDCGKNYTTATVTVGGDGDDANLVAHLADGVIRSVTSVDSGSGYTGGATIEIPGGDSQAIVFPNIGTGVNAGKIMSYTVVYGGEGYTIPGILVGTESGIYTQNKGFVSDTIKLQDSYFYQKFSYVIRTGNNVDTWKDSFNKLVHPAGFIFFGEILILLEFLDTKAKMPAVPPGYIDTADLYRVFIFVPAGIEIDVTSISVSGGVVTATISPNNSGLVVGNRINIVGASGTQESKLNGSWLITEIPDPEAGTTFRFVTADTIANGTYPTTGGNIGTFFKGPKRVVIPQPELAELFKVMSLDVRTSTNYNELMRYYDESLVYPYLGLTIQQADGFSQETPADPLYPYGDYSIDDVINSVIYFNDVRLGAKLTS